MEIIIGFIIGFIAACAMFAGWRFACVWYEEICYFDQRRYSENITGHCDRLRIAPPPRM